VSARHWLFKSDPESFSFDDLLRAPGRTTRWDGIRNAMARNFLRDEVAEGDRIFIYHSSSQPSAIVGIAEVVGAPKSEAGAPLWYAVEIRGVERLARPVTLEEVKADAALAKMMLVTHGRLSIQPVTPEQWKGVLALAKRAPGKAPAKTPAKAAVGSRARGAR
jgi:predicted RNA-binding protein with PUA-like domain